MTPPPIHPSLFFVNSLYPEIAVSHWLSPYHQFSFMHACFKYQALQLANLGSETFTYTYSVCLSKSLWNVQVLLQCFGLWICYHSPLHFHCLILPFFHLDVFTKIFTFTLVSIFWMDSRAPPTFLAPTLLEHHGLPNTPGIT